MENSLAQVLSSILALSASIYSAVNIIKVYWSGLTFITVGKYPLAQWLDYLAVFTLAVIVVLASKSHFFSLLYPQIPYWLDVALTSLLITSGASTIHRLLKVIEILGKG